MIAWLAAILGIIGGYLLGIGLTARRRREATAVLANPDRVQPLAAIAAWRDASPRTRRAQIWSDSCGWDVHLIEEADGVDAKIKVDNRKLLINAADLAMKRLRGEA